MQCLIEIRTVPGGSKTNLYRVISLSKIKDKSQKFQVKVPDSEDSTESATPNPLDRIEPPKPLKRPDKKPVDVIDRNKFQPAVS